VLLTSHLVKDPLFIFISQKISLTTVCLSFTVITTIWMSHLKPCISVNGCEIIFAWSSGIEIRCKRFYMRLYCRANGWVLAIATKHNINLLIFVCY